MKNIHNYYHDTFVCFFCFFNFMWKFYGKVYYVKWALNTIVGKAHTQISHLKALLSIKASTYTYVYISMCIHIWLYARNFVCVCVCVHLILTLTNFHLLLLRDWNYSPIFAPSSYIGFYIFIYLTPFWSIS